MKIPWGKVNTVGNVGAVIVGAVLFSHWLVTGASWLRYLVLCFAFAWVVFFLYAMLNALKQLELKLGVEFGRMNGAIQILNLDIGFNDANLSGKISGIAQLQLLHEESFFKPIRDEATGGGPKSDGTLNAI